MKILYLTHTDWAWIKQRTQHMAEELARRVECHIRYKISLRRNKLVPYVIKPDKCKGLLFLPFFLRKYKLIKIVDLILFKIYFIILNKFEKFDIIIITHPLLYEYISWHKNIVYDLHDDYEEFYQSGSYLQKEIRKQNKIVLDKASAVIYSSMYLFKKYPTKAKIKKIIRNGHNVSGENNINPASITNSNVKIFYFGTISKWFDQVLLEKCVNLYDDIEFHIIGPADVHLKKMPRVFYYGPLSHSETLAKASSADCFIMPFIVNELVKGVDPIKVYEYISFGKPIIIPDYEEVRHFSDFVYYYTSHEDFLKYINELRLNRLPPKSTNLIHSFLRNSSWSARADELFQVLKELVL
ncbi:MAG: hypothetical protein QXH10_10045 [Ignisphaera sp.]